MAVQSGRQAEELGEPVERHLLQLLESRRRAPEDPDLVQPRDQELGQDPRLGGGADEVGEEARALPVGQAGQEDVVEIAEDVRERLRLLGRRGGQTRANLPRLDLREHRQLADALEVRGDPLERRRTVLAEAHGPTPNGNGRELAPAVGLELLEQRCRTDRTGDRKKRRYAGANLLERHSGPRVARERRVRHRLVDLSPVRRGVRVRRPEPSHQLLQRTVGLRRNVGDYLGEFLDSRQHELERAVLGEERAQPLDQLVRDLGAWDERVEQRQMQADTRRPFRIEPGSRRGDSGSTVLQHQRDRRPEHRPAHFRSFSISAHGRVFRICSFDSHARRACAIPSST